MACNPTCLQTAPALTFSGCGVKNLIRSGFIKHLLFTRCDVPITDITDATEFENALTAGTMFLSPEGTGDIPFPALSDPITVNCKAEVNLKKTWSLNFTSYESDNVNQEDVNAWCVIEETLDTWHVAAIDCDDNIILPKDFASGDNLGFGGLTGTIANVYPNTPAMEWQAQLSFVYAKVLNPIPLDPAVITALGL